MTYYKVFRVIQKEENNPKAGVILEDTNLQVPENCVFLVLAKEYRYEYDAMVKSYILFNKNNIETIRLTYFNNEL